MPKTKAGTLVTFIVTKVPAFVTYKGIRLHNKDRHLSQSAIGGDNKG